jgi:hypothetical protein
VKDSLGEEIEYKEHLVAFIDFLGFKEKIRQYDKQKAEEEIYLLQRIFQSLSYSWETKHKNMLQTYRSLDMKYFSDCACIATPFHQNDFDIMKEELAWMQYSFTRSDKLIRGAISHGRHFHNKWIIFSKGLLNAIDLEKKTKFPRIAIDESTILEHEYHSFDYIVLDSTLQEEKTFFIDYLEMVSFGEYEDFSLINEFVKHKNIIENGLREYKNDKEEILRKYEWLGAYHNFKVCSFNGACDKDDLKKFALIDFRFPPHNFIAGVELWKQICSARKLNRKNVIRS